MRIALDTTVVRNERITGIERYVVQLAKHLCEYSDVNLHLLCSKHGLHHFSSCINQATIHCSPFHNRILTEQIWLPFICSSLDVDLVHLTTLGPSPFIKRRTIVTLHDTVPWMYPETISTGMRYYYKPLLTHYLAKKLPHIITVSHSSKRDIASTLNRNLTDIYVTYNGLTINFQAKSESVVNTTTKKYGLHRPYIVCLSTMEPRKNIRALISAFLQLSDEISHELVLVGRNGWGQSLGNSTNRIKFTGYVGEHDLPAILSGADLFVFPSLHEGFGIPLLEAQGCGVPVAASDIPSLREIAGSTVLYFNPNNVSDIAITIKRALNSRNLLNTLIYSGLENCKRFHWTKTAQETIHIYKTVTRGGTVGQHSKSVRAQFLQR